MIHEIEQQEEEDGETITVKYWQIAEAPNSIPTGWIKIPAGGYMGYMTKPFVYPTKSESPFTSEAGSTVSAVLDTIKNTLGNYEHFFTPAGKYRFQPI
jgi:hypothetical protein